jgi:hypothetical protein
MSLQFWKPGTVGPGSTLDRATETEESVVQSAPPSGAYSIQAQRERLPIFKHRQFPTSRTRSRLYLPRPGEKLLYCIEKFGVTIVVGQTGCGKTTRQCLTIFRLEWRRLTALQSFHNIYTKLAGPRTEMLWHVRNPAASRPHPWLRASRPKSVPSLVTKYASFSSGTLGA